MEIDERRCNGIFSQLFFYNKHILLFSYFFTLLNDLTVQIRVSGRVSTLVDIFCGGY